MLNSQILGPLSMLDKFWKLYLTELVELLTANSRLPEHTRNPNLIGAYAEAAIKDLVIKMSGKSRCTTGSIISHGLVSSGEELKQLDLVIWDSTPLPAIFDRSGFAIVPQQSVHGVIEIKRSAYSGVGARISETLDWVEKNVDGSLKLNSTYKQARKAGSLQSLVGKNMGEIFDPDPYHIGLGVICARMKGQSDTIVDELVEEGRVVVLQEIDSNGITSVNYSHVAHLVEYLKHVRLRANNAASTNGISPSQIAEIFSETPPGPLNRKSRL